MLIMSQRERKRKMILEEVLKGRLRLCDAALKLEVSYRQAKRLKAAYRRAGDKGLVHKNRGKKGNRCYSDEFKAKTLAIYKQKYQGFCATFASEKLEEFDNITVHPETLRRWLLAANLITRQRKGNPHRQKRLRRERFGELVQIDGSEHDWFGNGKLCCLLNIVDDASSVTLSQLDTGETCKVLLSTFLLWVKRYGVPKAVYVDLKNLYVSPVKHIDDDIEKTLNVFERVCKLLNVEIIKAYSPQAKGRVERNHGIYQDRFVKELKLRNITTIAQANQYLLEEYIDKINAKFAKSPQSDEDSHISAKAFGDLNQIFCWEYTRVIRNDFTIRFDNQFYQIEKAKHIRLRSKKEVIVRRHLDDTISLWYDTHKLTYHQIDERPPTIKVQRKGISSTQRPTTARTSRHKTPWGTWNPNWLKSNKKSLYNVK